MTGFVYFIQAEHGGPIKIGYSANPQNRLAALQTSSPWKLRILALTPGNRWDEDNLHRRLGAHHLRGDWFIDCEAVLAALPGADQTEKSRLLELAESLTSALEEAKDRFRRDDYELGVIYLARAARRITKEFRAA